MKLNKNALLSALPSVAVVGLLVLGFIAGRYSAEKDFDSSIRRAAKAFTLEDLLDDREKQELVGIYHDEEKVLEEIDSFSWAVPNTPAPFVGTAPMPGQHGNAFINMQQFRYEKDIELPKPDNTFRIFITGGSTAYGSGAPSQDRTIAGYLGRILSQELTPVTKLNYEVVTAANPAWASTHERILIENKLSELDPDMIISFSGNNDVHWGNRGRNVLWFRTYADEYFLTLVRQAYEYTNQPDIPEVTRIETDEIPPSLVSRRLLKNIQLSSFVLSQEGIDYVFVLQPTLAVTGKSLTEREQTRVKHKYVEYFKKSYAEIDKVLGEFDAENYHYINMANVFDVYGDQEEIFMDSYHFGDKGNEIIAANIFSHIKNIIAH